MHNGKSPEAFRTISEAATEIGEQSHVLRFWEKQIKELKPIKNQGKHRYYRPEDIALLQAIRYFLRQRGYKIEGVQKLLRQHGTKEFIKFYQGHIQNPLPQKPLPLEQSENATDTDDSRMILNNEQMSRLRVLNKNMQLLRTHLLAIAEKRPQINIT